MTAGTVLVAHPSPDLYGSDRMLLESVDGLRAAGWRVVVTVPKPGPLLAELAARDVKVAVVDVPVLRKALLSPLGLARFVAGTLAALPRMLRLLRRTRPDAVYVNTVTVPLWIAAARLTGRPVLGHVHEAEEGLPRLVRFALALPLLLASSVVVNSRATRDVLAREVPLLGRRSTVVHNGIRGPAATPRLPDRPADPARLVVVGRLSRRKGCDTAVDAVLALREQGRAVRLDFVGSVFPGYEWYERELRARVERLGLTDVVRFHGFRQGVWEVYADADIALVPSFGESFGNAAVEAQLAGRPVVVSGVQGLLEIVDDPAVGVTVPPGDPVALTAAVGRLLDDWPWACRLAAAGREEAERRFAPERYRAQVAAAVAALAAERRAVG